MNGWENRRCLPLIIPDAFIERWRKNFTHMNLTWLYTIIRLCSFFVIWANILPSIFHSPRHEIKKKEIPSSIDDISKKHKKSGINQRFVITFTRMILKALKSSISILMHNPLFSSSFFQRLRIKSHKKIIVFDNRKITEKY